jgi:hypothetical protein
MKEKDEKDTLNNIIPSIDLEIKIKDDNEQNKINEENEQNKQDENNNEQVKPNEENIQIKQEEDNEINNIKEENDLIKLNEEDNEIKKLKEENDLIKLNEEDSKIKINLDNNLLKINEDNNIVKTNEDINQIKEEETKGPILENQSENISKIKISSEIYIEKTSVLNGKTIYHIKGNFLEKNEEIIRRYRDFDLLHIKLSHNWPGIFIPPIAQKKYFGNLDIKTINERIYQLDNFLKVSTKSEYLVNTDEIKVFLNKDILNSDTFQVEIKKLKQYNLKQISDNYTKYFSKYKSLKTKDFTDEEINICLDFINNFNSKLNVYKEQLVEFGEVKKTNIFRESRIASYFTDFEKYCMMEFTNNDLSSLFFFNGSSSLLENKNKYKKLVSNPYLVLSCWLRLKELELISMKNNLNEYKSLLAKKVSIENKQKDLSQKLKEVEEGRVSFLDKIMLKGDPQVLKEKYKNELDIQNNEVMYINNIVDILNAYLSIEVYKYFDDLKISFYDAVKKFAIIQRENCILGSDLWLKVKCKNREENENDEINDIFDILDENMNYENEDNFRNENNNEIKNENIPNDKGQNEEN